LGEVLAVEQVVLVLVEMELAEQVLQEVDQERLVKATMVELVTEMPQ
jgi:hypothetical protein